MPVRMLIAAMPEMLNSIVATVVAAQPALQVVARLNANDDLTAAVQGHEADVIIMSAENSRADRLAEELLHSRPRMRVLILTANGRAAHLYRLVPNRVVMDDVSPGDLLHALLDPDNACMQD